MPSLAQNLKRDVWVASGTIQGGVRQFAAPVLHKWNWRALSSSVEMMTFGPEYLDYRKAVTDAADVVGLARFDRVWMDSAPDALDPLARDADFYIVSVDTSAGGFADLTFKWLSPDGN